MFEKVLVANRGEIALRVIKACQEMGIKTVAVYSEADEGAPHVHQADESYPLGAPSVSESYLNMDKIIQACRDTGAQAVHPGYGFLSENSKFAKRCEDEGITFIGPSAETISMMGDKIVAKTTMEKAGVPVIPGYHGDSQETAFLVEKGKEIGFPLMVKASAGGGGKGMRLVESEEELEPAIEGAKRESKSAFGNDTVFLERYLNGPRHIEFQILGDKHGKVLHLFERECSIQRRHQKVVEETPSVALTPEMRDEMGEAAVKAARAVGYHNAGTVEFMVDTDRNFYFMEMNTRLQVEHAITEATTGIDLVKWQLRIAAGEPLTLHQSDLLQRGHAIECRIYAEDPQNGFLPSTGKITSLKLPRGVNIRHDVGIEEGMEVSPYYDPLLAKLIVFGENRDDAIQKAVWALSNYVTLGVTTNIPFLKEVISHAAFKAGDITTHFIDEHFGDWTGKKDDMPPEVLIAAGIVEMMLGPEGETSTTGQVLVDDPHSPWKQVGKWRMGG